MVKINDELKQILDEPDTLKVLAVNNREGVPHVVFKGTLHAEDNQFVFYDLLQSSEINKNLVNTIWFEKKLAINILSKDRRSFHIVGTPVKSVTAGKYFESVYENIQERFGRDTDLNAIWFIEPEEIQEVSFAYRQAEQREKFPILAHLDQITRRDDDE